jgi:hypothetical protein
MTFTRCFVKRYESNVLTHYRTANVTNATIRREGSRMVDNADISISGKNDIRVEDYLGYVQDNMDLEGIVGIWNFAGSVRDESGNDLHEENAYNNFVIKTGLTYPEQTGSISVNRSKVLGKRSMYFESDDPSRYLKIPDIKIKNANGTDSAYSTINWSQDFTLAFFVNFGTLSGTSTSDPVNGVLFDKYDDSTNKGIIIYTQTPQGSASTVRNLKIRIGNGTTNTIYTHTMTSTDWNGLDKHICVTRTNNVLKAYVENTEVISQTFTGDVTSTADIYIGKEYSESASALVEPSSTGKDGGMRTTYHQMRLYSRAWSTSEISTWVGLNAPTITLKFYGRIWKIDQKRSGTDKCYCKGLGGISLNSRIDSSILTGNTTIRDLNVYKKETMSTQIIQDILSTVNEKYFGTSNSDIIMINYQDKQKGFQQSNSTYVGYELKAPFIAEGSFLDILNDLSVLSETTFTFMPTGILQMEENKVPYDSAHSLPYRGGLMLSNRNCNIDEKGNDDSNLCNQLFVCARLDEFDGTYSRSGLPQSPATWTGTSFLFDGTDVFPISVTEVKRDGVLLPVTTITEDDAIPPTVNSYYLDKQKAKLFTYNVTGSPIVSFSWNFTYNLNSANIAGFAKSHSVSKIQTDTTGSITKNGLYSRKLAVPRLTPNLTGIDQDINVFATNFVNANKGDANNNIPFRIQVMSTAFIDHIIENNMIGIHYLAKGIGSTYGGNITPEYLQIKKIEYHYPNVRTILELGDFLYDSFDLEKESSEGLRNVQSNQF